MRRQRQLSVAITLICLGANACGEDEPMKTSAGEDTGSQTEWNLVWSDEFDGPAGTPPDPSVWSAEVGGDGWGNDQLEFNTDRTENAALDGEGNLAIVARQESFSTNQYTSARLSTAGNVTAQYGRIEARIKLPVGPGIWPAFWMLGESFDAIGWPSCGEIDIMEYRGQEPAIVHGTIHGPGYSAGQGITGDVAVAGGGLHQDFRVYAVEWEPGEIRWYVDDLHFHTARAEDLPGAAPWVYDQPFFIILNIAVGGTFVGPVSAETTFPQTMLVDYVRIYEEAN